MQEAKDAANRAKRGNTEFKVKTRKDKYALEFEVYTAIKARLGKQQRKQNKHNALFAHVATPCLVLHACMYHLFATFAEEFDSQEFVVLASKHAFHRVIQVQVRLMLKHYPFKESPIESYGEGMAKSWVQVPFSHRQFLLTAVRKVPTEQETAKARVSRARVVSLLSTRRLEVVNERWRVARYV